MKSTLNAEIVEKNNRGGDHPELVGLAHGVDGGAAVAKNEQRGDRGREGGACSGG
mgnify:CR=1 FL=1